MKTLILSLLFASVLPQQTMAASPVSNAQLQLFVNYDSNTKKYDKRLVSKDVSPLSAADLIQEGTGVCYFAGSGELNPEQLARIQFLLGQMIDIYNRAEPRFEMSLESVTVGPAPNTITFQINQRTETGAMIHTWPSVRRCIRAI